MKIRSLYAILIVGASLLFTAASSPESAELPETYRAQIAGLMAARAEAAAPFGKEFDKALASQQSILTKAGRVGEAAMVKAYREGGVSAKLLGQVAGLATEPSPTQLFVNTLEMKFVPVKGTEVLFCIHETRYRDYAAYAEANPGIDTNWKNQRHRGYTMTERSQEHPVVYVSWENASAFCKWLSEKEQKTYRLPTDREWSVAVGLVAKERWREGDFPVNIIGDPDEFPWGRQWPPAKGAGNYSDESAKAKAPDRSRFLHYIDRFDDGYPTTAPVMTSRRMTLGFMTWAAMCGSGWRTGGARRKPTVFDGVVVGMTVVASICSLPTAFSPRPAAGKTTLAFGWC